MNDSSLGDDLFGNPYRGADGEFLIVGLGASAGGIQVLKEFFANVPVDSGMAYVVILHLSPHHESRLAEILQSACPIPVTQVEDHVRVVPDHVYVISPNQSLSMSDGHLALSEMTRIEERRTPIDIFFRALAESHHARAVCVVLSGSGSDGSMGLKRVKEYGGVCIVQQPGEAEYPDMPRHAIATGFVDYVLPVAEIPAKIIAYKDRLGSLSIPAEPHHQLEANNQALREIFALLRARTGHDFSNYKRSTLLRRLERRIGLHELADLNAYGNYLREKPDEARALLKDLLISVTNFFRDPAAFDALEERINTSLVQSKGAGDQVRIWVAGCATGEEAYSIAMLLSERLDHENEPPTVQLFASDIDEWAIRKAREGYYTLSDVADVSPERLRRFFVREGEGYRVRREVRELVLFAQHNIIKDPPFSHLDLVACRNLLIYLNRTAQQRVLEVLHFALNPDGYLFLGSSESVESSSDLFVTVDKENHIFQNRAVDSRFFPIPYLGVTAQNPQAGATTFLPNARAQERITYIDLHQRLLEQYGPPSVLINENYDILHLSPDAGKFMQIPGGEPSLNLLKTIRPELRIDLNAALYQATQNRQTVEARGLPLKLDHKAERINLIVRPVLREGDTARGFILVLFEMDHELGDVAGVEPDVAPAEPRANQLEQALIRARAQLHSSAEQYELQQEELKASNEELQAMNEELRSAAEELETSKEELQSVNEELTTVNQELKIKVEELTQAYNDFQNLMNSTDIATIFLDRAIRVKLFTPRAQELFNLIPADEGRLLSDITSRLNDDFLMSDIGRVLETLQPVEREVTTIEKLWYSMRILPYRTIDDRISGVVLTFMDVTESKEADQKLRSFGERLRRATEIDTVGIIFFKPDGSIADTNDAFLRMSGYSRDDVSKGRVRWDDMTPSEWMPQYLQALEEFKTTGRTTPYEKEYIRRDGSRWWGLFSATQIGEDEGVEYVIDISARKEAEATLARLRVELEQRIQERTTELETATTQLAEAKTALAQVSAELSEASSVRARATRMLVSAQEDERKKLARDLHDQLGQQLTGLRLQLEILKGRLVEDEKAFSQIEKTQVIARQIETDIDFLAWELRPLTLDDLGLNTALNDYIHKWSQHANIPAEFQSEGSDKVRLAPEIETNLYRIAQEALNNIRKHSRASRAEVILERRDHHVVLIIEDNGSGFGGTTKTSEGMGILNMRERIVLLGGTLEIESVPGRGTTLFVRVPTSLAKTAD